MFSRKRHHLYSIPLILCSVSGARGLAVLAKGSRSNAASTRHCWSHLPGQRGQALCGRLHLRLEVQAQRPGGGLSSCRQRVLTCVKLVSHKYLKFILRRQVWGGGGHRRRRGDNAHLPLISRGGDDASGKVPSGGMLDRDTQNDGA